MNEIKKVVEGGYCIGCGACTLGEKNSGVTIALDQYGRYVAGITSGLIEDQRRQDAVCPFSDLAADESTIAQQTLDNRDSVRDEHFGSYLELFVGHVTTGNFRDKGSSGGFTSWLLAELLKNRLVDAVVHVIPRNKDDIGAPLYQYGISTTTEELSNGAKSHYYPVEMSGALQKIRASNMRFAVVGVPCFIKAIRLLCMEEEAFRQRIKYCVGLFCGHLKSTSFAELLAWQCGIHPTALQTIDFRTKLRDRPASQYGITVTGAVGGTTKVEEIAVSKLVGSDWGMGFFKYKACDYCDDISAETADVSVGDAWLPEYVKDSEGTNIVVVRNKSIESLIRQAQDRGELAFKNIGIERVKESQSANIRHRRQGLAYRLHVTRLAGEWYPRKRVLPAPLDDKRRCKVLQMRVRFREELPQYWLKAKSADDLPLFMGKAKQLIGEYQRLQENPLTLHQRFVRLMRRTVMKVRMIATKSCLA